MNYFGHVAFGSQFDHNAEFLLGSMLPDLANMVGSVPSCDSELLQSGVRFHLTTDDVFHAHLVFTERVRIACGELKRLGLRTGPARGVAHVGVELLLDVELDKQPIHGIAYREALIAAGPREMGLRLHWSTRDGPRKFESLRLRLIERSTCRDLFALGSVVERLTYVLQPRPRLRLSQQEKLAVKHWVHSCWTPFGDDLGRMWADLRAQVSARWTGQKSKIPET